MDALIEVLNRKDGPDEVGMIVCDPGELEGSIFRISEDGKKLGLDLSGLPTVYRGAMNMWKTQGIELNGATKVVVVLNGDNEMAWTMRRKLIMERIDTDDRLDWFEEEVRLMNLVLSKHFKSSPTWAHRHWVLEKCLKRKPSNVAAILDDELALCSKVAESYKRCYNAWSYRNTLCGLLNDEQLERERQAMHTWLYNHVSDFSSMSYLQCIVHCMGNPVRILTEEIYYATWLAAKYPGHEALWQHKRILVDQLIRNHISQQPLTSEDLENLETESDLIDTIAEGSYEGFLPMEPQSLGEILRNEFQFVLATVSYDASARLVLQQRCALSYLTFACKILLEHHLGHIPHQFATNLRSIPFRMPSTLAQPTNQQNIQHIEKWFRFAKLALKLTCRAFTTQRNRHHN